MWFIEFSNYDERWESVRADLIESVVKPSGKPNDNGCVRLIGGRIVAFGRGNEAERMLAQLQKTEPIDESNQRLVTGHKG